QHLAHDHAAEFAGNRGYRVDLKTDHGKTRHQLIAGNLRIYPTAQPLFTELHPALLNNSLTDPNALTELREEPQIVVEEQAQIIDSVTQHGQAFRSQAKGKALILFRVDTGHFQHAGANHAAAHHFQPAGLLAYPATFAAAHYALHIDLCRGLGEREE